MADQLPPPPAPAAPPSFHDLSFHDVVARVRASPASAAVVVLVACVVAGVIGWRAFGPQAAPVELTLPRATPASVGPGDGATGAGDSPAGADGAGAEAGPVHVHVAGAVREPGVYRLGPGARVADAIDAGGGPAGDADVDALNLAAKVVDGDRVYVPRKGETPPVVAASGGGGGGPGGLGAGGTARPALLDLNSATAAELEDLPGVGPATAAAIVEYRTEHGRFRSVDDLLEVRGIGEAKLASIRSKVRVG